METTQRESPARRFDYVCLYCGRVHQQSLSALVPGGAFTCPYCKSDFHVTGGKIQLKARRQMCRTGLDQPVGTKQRRHQTSLPTYRRPASGPL